MKSKVVKLIDFEIGEVQIVRRKDNNKKKNVVKKCKQNSNNSNEKVDLKASQQ